MRLRDNNFQAGFCYFPVIFIFVIKSRLLFFPVRNRQGPFSLFHPKTKKCNAHTQSLSRLEISTFYIIFLSTRSLTRQQKPLSLLIPYSSKIEQFTHSFFPSLKHFHSLFLLFNFFPSFIARQLLTSTPPFRPSATIPVHAA